MKRVIALIATTATPGIAFAGPYYCYNPMFPGGGVFMWLITIALFGLIIYLVYRNVKTGSSGLTKQSDDALSILKARLARGEITEEQYDRLKSRIDG